jgi:hypothetical protein
VERASEDFVTATTALSEQVKVHTFALSPHIFSLILLLLAGSAIVRSAVATRLDSFTLDEAYHIAAGVSYVTRNDFRLNPEHPPLVKLWVGAVMSLTGFHLSPFREMHDKFDERRFAQQDVFLNNDPDSVQRRSRLAMWALNGLLLVTLGFALRRVFNRTIALGTILFLAIDPTVAAHFPVVMTDLPVGFACGYDDHVGQSTAPGLAMEGRLFVLIGIRVDLERKTLWSCHLDVCCASGHVTRHFSASAI